MRPNLCALKSIRKNHLYDSKWNELWRKMYFSSSEKAKAEAEDDADETRSSLSSFDASSSELILRPTRRSFIFFFLNDGLTVDATTDVLASSSSGNAFKISLYFGARAMLSKMKSFLIGWSWLVSFLLRAAENRDSKFGRSNCQPSFNFSRLISTETNLFVFYYNKDRYQLPGLRRLYIDV